MFKNIHKYYEFNKVYSKWKESQYNTRRIQKKLIFYLFYLKRLAI